MKKLSINAAKTLILRNTGNFFGEFESVQINTANAIFSAEVYSELVKRGLKINTAKMSIIELTGEPIDIGDATLDGNADYSGKFLVGGTVFITDKNALNGAAGIYADRIIAPEGTQLANFNGTLITYPADAVVDRGDTEIVINESYVERLENGALVWTLGNVMALDNAAVEKMAEKDITVRCEKLVIAESAERAHGKRFRTVLITVIPDGCEFIARSLELHSENAELYGDMLYINGNLTIKANAAELLSNFRKIIVRRKATIPHGALAVWKQIGTAQNVTVYKGELWNIDGAEQITHEQLEAAAAEGLQYTLIIDGAVNIGAAVTKTDLDCISAVYYDGVVTLPAALIPAFKQKVVEGDGMLMPLAVSNGVKGLMDTVMELIPHAKPEDTESDDDTQKINTATFVLI